ncbi:MAG: NADH-quinone oxidoreductase subunit G [Propionibacteriaceae bacterium]|jgi:NADH-quinone oxidoreductase subunit G|nr:NADH-quinone oxidoreductase subunit G [Propionibacteriaceae bacterium]
MTETAVKANPELVTVTVDGRAVEVPKGTPVIRAAELAGVVIPRFCDHPLLEPIGACRQCLVEIPDAGNGRGFPVPQASCTTVAAQGMRVETAATSAKAKAAQEGVLELLLINHPLDCPICDKGGECPLQNQAMAQGRLQSRFDGVKRRFPKSQPLSAQLWLDRERCVLCSRCVRFADQIAGDDQLSLVERGARSQVAVQPGQPFTSYFAGNTVQICPVGALTSQSYRFAARPFDLVSTVTTCEGCAAGCQLRVDHRHYQVKRRLAGDLPAVNQEWNCDRGRFGFVSERGPDRLTVPLLRRDGQLVEASWTEALAAAAAGLSRAGAAVGVLTGGRLTRETAYAHARFARAVLGSNDIDFRARALSAEETGFLAAWQTDPGQPVTYADLDQAEQVVLVGLEPEDEAPIVFLRLRRAVRQHRLQVTTIAARRSPGSAKLDARLIATAPGQEAAQLAALDLGAGSIVLGGERLAQSPGALTALAAVVRKGGRWAWLPRRPGEVGALEAGAFPALWPQGQPVGSEAVARVWGSGLPTAPGRDSLAQVAALADGSLRAAVWSGVELADLPDPAAARAGLERADFVLSLERRLSEAAQLADVVLPVAPLEETSGSFRNWERRLSPVAQVIGRPGTPMTEIRVLAALADALGVPLGFRTPDEAAAELDQIEPPARPAEAAPDAAATTPVAAVVPAPDPALTTPVAAAVPAPARAAVPAPAVWTVGPANAAPDPVLATPVVADPAAEAAGPAIPAPAAPADPAALGPGEAVLATWRELLDDARLLDHEPALRASARPVAARLNPATAAALGLDDARRVTLGGLEFDLVIDPTVADNVVWAPSRAPGLNLAVAGLTPGRAVAVTPVAVAPAAVDPAERPSEEAQA